MVSKKRINRPKLCFTMIRLRIIFIITRKIIFRYPFIHLSFFSFFNFSFLLVPFSLSLYLSLFIIFLWFSIFLSFFFHFFVFAHFPIFHGVKRNTFWNSNFSHLPSSIRHLIAYSLLENIFFAFIPSVGGDP